MTYVLTILISLLAMSLPRLTATEAPGPEGLHLVAALRDNPLRSKVDLQRAVNDLFTPLVPLATANGFQLGENHATYHQRVANLEAFARTWWSVIPLGAGGGKFAHWDLLRGILNHGTDPSQADGWQAIAPIPKDQRAVEIAAIATGILLYPQQTWEPLTPAQRRNLVTWLASIRNIEAMDNNWTFFRILAYTALRSVGEPIDEAQLTQDFATIETCWLGDGWYSDGRTPQRDYYIPMAMHYYGLLYAVVAKDRDPARAALYRQRAARFAQDFSHWFTPTGDAIPFGRSLTYRYAQAAFWSALAYADVDVPGLSRGAIKGLLLRNLRWWFAQPIFSDGGLLTIGYRYPSLLLAESYNSAGSPYWSGKAFLALALPDEHPFWSTPEEPLPARATVSRQPHAGMVIVHDEAHPQTIAYATGQDASRWMAGQAPKYGKFAYSTVFGFCVLGPERTLEFGGFDSSLVVSDDGSDWRMRNRATGSGISEAGVVWSQWQPWSDVTIDDWIVPCAPGHLRLHRIRTARPLAVADTGFSLPVDDDRQPARLHPRLAVIENRYGTSAIRGLLGEPTALMTTPFPNLNVLHPLVRIPAIRQQLAAGETWLASAVCAMPGADAAPLVEQFLGRMTVRQDGDRPILLRDGQPLFSAPP